jgi:hypothetical protein
MDTQKKVTESVINKKLQRRKQKCSDNKPARMVPIQYIKRLSEKFKRKIVLKKKLLRKMKPKELRDKPQRVHRIPCIYGREYISETNRQLGVRILIYLCTLWSRVLLEKLTGSLLVKKFSAFYGIQRFITAFTRARHLSLSCTRSIQSIPPIQLPEDPNEYYPPIYA